MLIEWFLQRQAGVISRAQAVEGGMLPSAISRKLATGKWERVHPGVYLAGDREFGDEARLRAALLWAGAEATVHGVSAAWWHGLVDTLPATVEVTVPRGRRAGRRPGILVRRRDLVEADHIPLRCLQVTALPLTAMDAAVALGPQGLAIEVDGWAWHVDVERFRADRRRQNELVADGWTVLRFTWHDLDRRGEQVISGRRRAGVRAVRRRPVRRGDRPGAQRRRPPRR